MRPSKVSSKISGLCTGHVAERELLFPDEGFEQSMKVQTVASAKGLQYRVVFVMWADLFEPHTRADLDMQQRYLYVAMTRASDVLIVTYSKGNEFIERMVKSGDAMVCG